MAIALVPRPAYRRRPSSNLLANLATIGLAGGLTMLLAVAITALVPDGASRDESPVAGPVRVLAPVVIVAQR